MTSLEENNQLTNYKYAYLIRFIIIPFISLNNNCTVIMTKVFLVLLAIMAVIAVAEGGYRKKNRKRRCNKRINKFQQCLDDGYESQDGCISGDGNLSKKKERRCRKWEKKAKKCNFECDKPEVYDKGCVREGVDFKGADISWFDTDSFETCAEECATTPQCKSITYQYDPPYCWLKNKEGGREGPNMDDRYASMNMECDTSELDTSCKDVDTDYAGSDIQHTHAPTFEECAVFCKDTAECVSITYRASDQSCWLKHKEGHNFITPNTAYPGLESMNMKC